MKVLTIGMDRKLFEEGSAVLERSLAYASKMEELHIIVFSLKKHNLKPKVINNLHLYPTNSISRIIFLWDAYKLGKNIIIQNKFVRGLSVISAQDPMSIVGYALSKKFKLPLQLQIHTDLFSPYFKNSLTNWKNFWYSGWVNILLTKFLIKRTKGIRVVGQDIKDLIKKKFPSIKAQIDVLPIYVDVNEIISAIPKRDLQKEFPQFKFIILMASRLSPEKRFDVAFKSFKNILSNFPQAGLIIAGEGNEKGHLESLVRELGLKDNVVFIGWQNDLVSLYKTADVFLLTSEYEGYGMTLIEAGASGCPIVTTKVGVANTGLFKNGENSFVCSVGDVDCLAKSINKLISNNSYRELFKRSMQDSIKFTLISKEEYTNQYVSLLQKLLK